MGYANWQNINCTTEFTEILKGTHENVHVYAKWNQLYTITYQTYGLGDTDNPTQFHQDTANFALKDAVSNKTPDGKGIYTFAGWYADEAYTTKVEQFDVSAHSANTTLYARWKLDLTGVSLKWEDGNNQDGKRPENVEVILMPGVQSAVLPADNLTLPFTDLDLVKNGQLVNYELSINTGAWGDNELNVPLYQFFPGDLMIGDAGTLYHNPAKKDFIVKLNWIDQDNLHKKRPSSVTVQLFSQLRRASIGDPVTITEADGWMYTWKDLPVHPEIKARVVSVQYEAEITSEIEDYEVESEFLDAEKYLQQINLTCGACLRPEILSPAEGDEQMLMEGDDRTLDVKALRADTYRWYVDKGNGKWELLGETGPSLRLDNISENMHRWSFRCVALNGYGADEVEFSVYVVTLPKTGDSHHPLLWSMMLLISGIGAVLLAAKKRRA